MGQPDEKSLIGLALKVLANKPAIPSGTSTDQQPERSEPATALAPQDSKPDVESHSSPAVAEQDVLGHAARILEKAWEILEAMEDDGDLRGSVTAVRECRESLDRFASVLRQTRQPNLAAFSDEAILSEAERRNLKMDIRVRIVYDDPLPNPEV